MRDWLKQLRNSKGYTQQNVADELHISKQYYQQIENGERQKNLASQLVILFAEIFGLRPSEILEREKAYLEAKNSWIDR